MNIQRELRALLASGLRFSLEVKGVNVRVWVGNYAGRTVPNATFASVEQAIRWLQRYVRGAVHAAT